jgi:hypothetical protein
MFRIENLFCDDKKLPQLLHAISGLVLEGFSVVPVVNVERKGKKLEAISNGTAVEMFANYLHKRKITEVNSTIGREFCTSIGKDPETYNGLFTRAKAEGLLRKVGKGTSSKWRVRQ